MKIAIVTGHFMPEIGYQETQLAKAWSRAGNEVEVFTTTAVSPTGKKILKNDYPDGIFHDEKYGYKINRLKPLLRLNSKVVARRLKKNILEFNPDLVIILALSKLFPVPVLSKQLKSIRRAALFGDAAEYADRSTFAKQLRSSLQQFVSFFLKRYLYNKAIRNCSAIILNIPETEVYFNSLLGKKNKELFEEKKVLLTLGYDPDTFYYDGDARKRIRAELGIPEAACVLVTATRVNRRKNLEQVIGAVSRLKEAGFDVHYLLIGLHSDDYSGQLLDFISGQQHPGIFHTFPFLDAKKVCGYFAASDIGLWTKPAISIQEAMGTGLMILLEEKPSVSHLLQQNITGWYHQPGDFEAQLKESCRQITGYGSDKRKELRLNASEINRKKFSYDVVAQKIIEQAK